MKRISIKVALVFLMAACSPSENQVTQSQFGDKWPFTVESGYVDCVQPSRAIFRANGEVYALNGLARSAGYKPIDEIWRDDPTGVLPKINIGQMISLALAQCK